MSQGHVSLQHTVMALALDTNLEPLPAMLTNTDRPTVYMGAISNVCDLV